MTADKVEPHPPAAVLDPNPRATALVPTPRLLLTQTRASRAVLDGAWWPRSTDALAELSNVVPALSERYGRIRSVLLNGSAWSGRDRRLAVADHVVRVGWFASMTTALLVAITDDGDQIDLLIVPPDLSQEAANGAMAKAADPANVEHAPDLLQAAGPATRAGPTRIALADVAEAAWDNEGGARPAANLTDGRRSDAHPQSP